MTDTPRISKANGHIVQADWNQTDPLKMDYIHNKPDLSNVGLSREEIIQLVQDELANTLLNGEW